MIPSFNFYIICESGFGAADEMFLHPFATSSAGRIFDLGLAYSVPDKGSAPTSSSLQFI